MVSKICNAVGLAFLLALIASMAVSAKGGFSFLSITGPGIEKEVRATDLKLTEDFFAFANFHRDQIGTPKDPGVGYEITRYYIDVKREIAFDRLHYYPSAGIVFYDGIVNGDSEYDGEWYAANPNIKSVFESILPSAVRAGVQPAAATIPANSLMPAVILAGLLALAVLALRLRRPVLQ